MPRKESSVRATVTRELNLRVPFGLVWFSVPAGPFSRRGVPDIIGLFKGVAFAIELKSSTGEPTPLQKLFAQRWLAAGGCYAVVREKDDLTALMNEVNRLILLRNRILDKGEKP